MTKNDIKKALYKQNPWASKNFVTDGVVNYSTEIEFDNTEEIVEFEVPISDMGENVFEDTLEAKFLIRWLK